jgi:Mg2+/Co2+ transporter CorB
MGGISTRGPPRLSDLPIGFLFLLLGILIVLSAFFSGSETALMTLNRYRLRHLVKKGHRGANLAHRLLQRPDRLIGVILLGNNFVNILASSVATVIAIRLVGGDAAIAWSAGLLTVVILIFSEVTPKTLAALHPERLALPASYPLTLLLRLLYPIVWLTNLVANGLLRLLGVSADQPTQQILTPEELRIVVVEAGAMIPSSHQQMLLSILDLGKATVDEIMIPRQEVEAIDLEEPMEEIIRQLRTSHFTRIPLYEGNIDNIVGVIHIRAALHAMLAGDLDKEKLRAVAHEPNFIPQGTPLSRQLLNFQRERRHIGLVVDEYGDFQGLVTLADLLEEIVGEFTTDPSDNIPEVHPQADGSVLVAGSANLRDLVRTGGWELPTDGPRTINGLILEYMETIPEPGTSLKLFGYPMEILQIQDNAVKMVRIWPDQRRKPDGDA